LSTQHRSMSGWFVPDCLAASSCCGARRCAEGIWELPPIPFSPAPGRGRDRRQRQCFCGLRLRPRCVGSFELHARSFFRHPGIVFPGVARMFRRRRRSYGCRAIRVVAPGHLNRIAKSDVSLPDGIVHFRTLAPLLPVEKNNGYGPGYGFDIAANG
jgi:hypothetical protein